MEVVASLSQGRTAAAQCGLFTYKSVPVIFEPPCMQHSTISEIAVAMSAKMPSAVVSFLLSAVLLALCEYGPRVQIGYNL